MRIKWNYPLYLGGLVLALATAAVSCMKDSTSPSPVSANDPDARLPQQKAEELQNKYSWTGRYHTEALDYVYARLAGITAASSRSDQCRKALGALKEFDKSFSKDGKSRGIADDFLTEDLCNDMTQLEALPAPLNARSLSPQATAMVQQIQDAIRNRAPVPTTVSRISAIENAASGSLSTAEAGAIVALGSVAINSAQYWDANLGNWLSASSNLGASYQLSPENRPIRAAVSVPASPRHWVSGEGMELGMSILSVDVNAFISSLLTGWWMGAIDIEVSAIRAAAASLMAGLFG
jgi:hypothetical protein